MDEFNFITDEQLRTMIERDKNELDSCLAQGLCKSTLLLSGSIVEAILVDFFLAFPYAGVTSNTILSTNLATLIEWAEKENLISARSRELSIVVKNYRNLIHPGREYRLNEKVDIRTATVAANLVEMIIDEVAESYAKRRGYTADQAIKKVILDPSAGAIFQHIIDKMSPIERIKLFRMLPEIQNPDQSPPSAALSFIELHNKLKASIPEGVFKSEASKAYEYLRTKSQADALYHLRFFIGNLNQFEDEQREAIISYLFGILDRWHELTVLRQCLAWRIFENLALHTKDEYLKGLKDLILRIVDEPIYDESASVLESIIASQMFPQLSTEFGTDIISALRKVPWNKHAAAWAELFDANLNLPF